MPMDFAAKLDDWGKPAWITLMILGFILFWPLGLVILGFLIGSGRMGCWKSANWRKWRNSGSESRGASGNSAFDEYREETLKRLEEEQQEFEGFLDQLRRAKDKAEFDQFMAQRRNRPRSASGSAGNEPGAAPDGPAPQPA